MVRGLLPNYPPPSTGLSNFLHVPHRLLECLVGSLSPRRAIGTPAYILLKWKDARDMPIDTSRGCQRDRRRCFFAFDLFPVTRLRTSLFRLEFLGFPTGGYEDALQVLLDGLQSRPHKLPADEEDYLGGVGGANGCCSRAGLGKITKSRCACWTR
jgi:hypothetical protein